MVNSRSGQAATPIRILSMYIYVLDVNYEYFYKGCFPYRGKCKRWALLFDPPVRQCQWLVYLVISANPKHVQRRWPKGRRMDGTE